MSKAASFGSSLVLFLVACSSVPLHLREQGEIERAMAANDCRLLDHYYVFVAVTDEARAYAQACWDKLQEEIIPAAMQRNDCRAVLNLPGYYPHGRDQASQRFVYHCWISRTGRHLDSCIGLISAGDAPSVPYLIKALKDTLPVPDEEGQMHIEDTASACFAAWQGIENLSEDELRAHAAGWSPRWKEWAAQRRPLFGPKVAGE